MVLDEQDLHQDGDSFTLEDVKNGVCTQQEYEDGKILSNEGDNAQTIESKPTAAINSFGLILDEFGAYASLAFKRLL